jgi:hypothetical protein
VGGSNGGAAGGNGGTGGAALGGGVFFSNLTGAALNFDFEGGSTSGNTLRGGAGGAGGNAFTGAGAPPAYVPGGTGGVGGQSAGGGIYVFTNNTVGSSTTVTVGANGPASGVTIDSNAVTGGRGGFGGAGSGSTGSVIPTGPASGGAGGLGAGGGLYVQSTNAVSSSTALTLEFSTLAGNTATGGNGGNGGSGTTPNGGPGGNGGTGGDAQGGAFWLGDDTTATVINSTFGDPASSNPLNNALNAGTGGAGNNAGTPNNVPYNDGGNGGNGGNALGGAVYVHGSGPSAATFLQTTIVNNQAVNFGLGGVAGKGAHSSGPIFPPGPGNTGKASVNGVDGNGMGGGIYSAVGTVSVGNNLIALNAATLSPQAPVGALPGPDVHGTFNSLGNNMLGVLDGGATGFNATDRFTGDAGGDTIDAATLTLNPLANNNAGLPGVTDTVSMNQGSVAIGAGSTNLVSIYNITTDQRGFPRIHLGAVDPGSFENQFPPLVTVTAVNDKTGLTEGGGTGTFTVATFTSSYGAETASQFTVVVSWGDGTTSTITSANGLTGGSGSFVVKTSHTYADEINSATVISVQVTDVFGASVSGQSSSFTVADASLGALSINNPVATEGAGFSGFTVATFTDSYTASPVTDFTATVTWGDGTSSAGAVVTTSTPGNYAVLASHVYAEEGNYTLSVKVLDEGSASVTGNLTISVADAALSGLTLSDPGATEGQSFSGFTVATFTDANAGAPVTDFTATVTWGDGTSSSASVVSLGGGNFAVVAGTTYAEETPSPITLSVAVLDVGGASISGSITVSVADAPLAGLNISDPGATEGQSFSGVVVATFSDSNAAAPATDFTATVTWGDGTSNSASVVSLGGGAFEVVSGHTYAEEGTNTLAVQVLDVGGASISGSITIAVADASLGNLTVSDPLATEGVGFTGFIVATFSDANTSAPVTDFTATVTWGDGTGSAATVVSTGGGNFAVVGSHTYAEESGGPITLSVAVQDVGGSTVGGSINVTVADATLSLTTVHAPPEAIKGQNTGTFTVATFTDGNTGAPLTDFTAVISWGDGTTSTVNSTNGLSGSGGSFAIQSSHTYAAAISTATVLSVQVLDVGGSSVNGQSSPFTVANQQLTLTVNVASAPVEGISSGTFTVATFTDAKTGEPASNFTAVIGWGDGTSSTVTSANGITGSGGNFVVKTAHTYADESTTATVVSVQITDSSGTATSGTSSTFTVADAPLTITGPNAPFEAIQGVSTGTFTVATFTDGNTGAPLTDFTAVVNWGDGSSSTITSANGLGGSGGNFAIQSSHTYSAAITVATTLSVQITDEGGSSVNGTSSSFTVAAQQLTINKVTAPTGLTEGQGTGTFTVASFTDVKTADKNTNFTAVVSWGDGTTSTITAANGLTGSNGNFVVKTSHTYHDEVTTATVISVQITDTSSGTATSGQSASFTVADAPLTLGTVNAPTSPQAGVSTGTFTVATFTDAYAGAPISDFTALIGWGDGTTTTVTSANGLSGSGGNFVVKSSHTYGGKISTPTSLSVQILDEGGSSVNGNSSSFTVAPGQLAVTSVNRVTGLTEGQGTGTFTVATFTDAKTTDPASNFTAVIGWGDGTTSTVTSANGLSGSGGSFVVQASHTYADEVTTASVVSVQILDSTGPSASSVSASFTVADAALTNLAVNAPTSPVAGSSTGTFTVATFTDGDAKAPLTDYTAVISWGDGTTSTVTSANGISGSGGSVVVKSSHAYAAAVGTPIHLSVQVLDEGGASVSGNSSSFTVSTSQLNLTSVNAPTGLTEGQSTGTFTVATFTDANTTEPASNFTAVIGWGDGTSSTVTSANGISGGGGSFVVKSSHFYAEEFASATVLSIQITDSSGTATSGTSPSFAVADAPLTLTAVNAPTSPVKGQSTGTFTVANFNDANVNAPLTDFTAVISWGDGTTSTVTSANGISGSGGSFVVQSSHTYTAAIGTPTHLSVQILDVGGAGVNGNSSSFTVSSQQLTLTAVNAVSSATEGQNTGTFTVATFTDVNTSEPATNFTALVQWGDGTTSTVTSANGLVGSGGSFTVLTSHTYADEVTTPTVISVQILDSSGASTSSSSPSFTVADALLTLTAVNAPTSAGVGTSTGLFTVADFTDANTGAPPSDFTAVITWGDGTTSTITSANGLSGFGGSYAVQTSHTYVTPLTTQIGVHVIDVGGSNVSGTSPTFSVPTSPPSPPSPPSGGGSSAAPGSSINLINVSSSYTLFTQVETVSLQVLNPNGSPVASGVVTITDGGVSHTVSVVNGLASTTFTFSLFAEQPSAHGISANFGGINASFMAPSTETQYFFQIFFDLLLFEALTGGGSSGG